MTGPAKRKGDRAEREVAAMIRDELGLPAHRAFGAGRRDDVGDIVGMPSTVIQVVDWRDVTAAVRAKPNECELQRQEFERQIGHRAFGATFVRLKASHKEPAPVYRIVLLPSQFFAFWKAAA